MSTSLERIANDTDLTDPSIGAVTLVAWRHQCDQAQKDAADAKRAIDAELMRRMELLDTKRLLLPDGTHVELHRSASRRWDADDLETVVRDLADRGAVNPAQYTGLIRTERRVNGHVAQQLLAHTTGQAHAEIEQCFEWQPGRPTIIVIAGHDAIDATSEEDE